jgi:hypothetical protein
VSGLVGTRTIDKSDQLSELLRQRSVEHSVLNARLVDNVHPNDWANPSPAPRYNLVVLGGGVAGALPFMRAAMISQVRARAFRSVAAEAKIVRAALGANSGVVGAAYAALHPDSRTRH